MEYEIRPATLADVPGIAEVARHTWNVTYAQSIAAHNREQFLERAYSHYALRQAIRRESRWFYVALQMETVVGFAHYLRRFDAEGELARIYVHPDHQRRGIGRALLAIGLGAMAADGVGRCYVSVAVDNAGARAFYEKFGFRLRRTYGRFLGDQLIHLAEYVIPVTDFPDTRQRPTTRARRG